MGFLTGGSKQESGNKAYPWLKEQFGGSGAAYGSSIGQFADILGLNGSQAGGQALDDYWDSAGGQFQLDQGLEALNGKYATMGLSKSGSAMKGMEKFRSGLASTYLDNYLGNLGKLGGLGLGGGGLIAQGGQYSKGSQKEGLGGFIGSLISSAAMASDIRLKTNVALVGALADGLNVYDYDYRRDIDPSLPEGRQRGVMAHEVAELRPHALGPLRPDGYSTVDYDKLAA